MPSSIYCTITDSNILGPCSGVKITSEQGALAVYCVYSIPDSATLEPCLPAATITVPEYAQLKWDLAYINEHDEFADVASGNSVVEDSLLNEILEPTSKPVTNVQAEFQASEAQEQSSIHWHLSAALKQIKKEINAHSWPESSCQRDFFYHPKHPVTDSCLCTPWCCDNWATIWSPMCLWYLFLVACLSSWCTWLIQVWWSSLSKIGV